MWDIDEDRNLALHFLVAHDTAMLIGDSCGLRLSLAANRREPETTSIVVQAKMTVDQAQALIHDLQRVVDWTRLSPAERKARAQPAAPKKTVVKNPYAHLPQGKITDRTVERPVRGVMMGGKQPTPTEQAKVPGPKTP